MKMSKLAVCFMVSCFIFLFSLGMGLGMILSHGQAVALAASSEVVTDYGNGVYYFAVRGREFGQSLSSFIERHPDLELVSVSGEEHHTASFVHFVVFRQKSK